MTHAVFDEAKLALLAFQSHGPFAITRIPTGLINQTFRVDGADGSYILQRLHPVFGPKVNLDIEAVTKFLQQKSMKTPQLVATDEKSLWTMVGDHCWRMQTLMEGQTFDQVKNPRMCYLAGQLAGKFHLALEDFSYSYSFVRPGVHDTAKWMAKMESFLVDKKGHERYELFARLAEKQLRAYATLPKITDLPLRNCHGDLKISNVLFNKQQPVCLLDLDTLGLMSWPLEMGDAFRSWCNPQGEDTQEVFFSEEIFAAGIEGYASAAKQMWTSAEKEMLLVGMKTIPLELSARFLVDVLEDSYWGWDSTRYASRAEHNLLRATGQWELYLDIERKSFQLSQRIHEAFA